jgi:hypothetical protein
LSGAKFGIYSASISASLLYIGGKVPEAEANNCAFIPGGSDGELSKCLGGADNPPAWVNGKQFRKGVEAHDVVSGPDGKLQFANLVQHGQRMNYENSKGRRKM